MNHSDGKLTKKLVLISGVIAVTVLDNVIQTMWFTWFVGEGWKGLMMPARES